MNTKNILFLVFLYFANTVNAQTSSKKVALAHRVNTHISIDGKLNEEEWKNALPSTDFIMFYPDNGKEENKNKKTEVRIIYDDDAIYVGAIMYDNPENILQEIKLRDEFGTSDHFGVFFNGFNDNQLEYRFFISAAGVQLDAIATSAGEDYSWDAIWDCKVKITENSWVAEFKIPYAALRFSEKEKQTWGLNMFRDIKKDNTSYCWNFIDSKLNDEVVQAGILEGIENIKPPTRLFFIPYTSYYHNNNDSGSNNKFKIGMDIKYGINDSFTLDAILVPDFGQTTFDNVNLVLGPFEQQFNENRPFFTEGTDLFNKGNLFYSRRIGASPTIEPTVTSEEEITEYPNTTNLLNATKISGRTSKGLGIGFLNAITENTYATISNTTTNNTRKELVEPITNFNVFVLDQRFRKNSSVSFINTSVVRNGTGRDANVSGLVFDLNTKANSFKLSGDTKFSYVNNLDEIKRGTNSSLFIGDTKGKYQYGFGSGYISKEYDHNDLGILFRNNYYSFNANASYRTLKKTKTFNNIRLKTELNSEFENSTGKLQLGTISFSSLSYNLKNDILQFSIEGSPFETFDFYFPGIDGRFNYNPKYIEFTSIISSNKNRKYSFDLTNNFIKHDQPGRKSYTLSVGQQYRFNDKFYVRYTAIGIKNRNDIGLIDYDNSEIIYARRNINTLEHQFTSKYSINNVMNFNLKVRYYWAHAINNKFLTLREDGYFDNNLTYNLNKNINRNIWNFDFSYTWWFAPGSLVSVLYRNNSSLQERAFNTNFGDNFRNVLSNNPNNAISISFRYYIDYNQAKNVFKHRE
ncbi:DUF5916 domain-containing protein [uncultured Flavobacterium sp.]|uniref:DUF5916 domain-containing protein n=1 Tax=uncultured Flavobacterium sp. TaxID=165435 RepID=UPI0030EC8D96|tara:strand:+ start:2247 stop:4658 length:2412 start_codon:yes stop_codon:yes gene_type:complete